MILDLDSYMILLALATSSRHTCPRRGVGAIITDSQGHILSTGYNGVPHGFDHCTIKPCPGANEPSGEGLDKCIAIHAEANAIIHCDNIRAARTIYSTDSPCIDCTKLLLGTPITKIVYFRKYPHSAARQLWIEGDGEIAQIKDISQLRAIAHVSATIGVAVTHSVAQLIAGEDPLH